jgi:hypothetical protein
VLKVLEAATVLDLREATVTGRLELQLKDRPKGAIDFRSAHVGVLWDEEKSWPALLRLHGFIYQELGGNIEYRTEAKTSEHLWPSRRKRWNEAGPDARLRWLDLNPDQRLRWLRDNPKKWQKADQYVYA